MIVQMKLFCLDLVVFDLVTSYEIESSSIPYTTCHMRRMTMRFCNAYVAIYKSYTTKLQRVYWALAHVCSCTQYSILVLVQCSAAAPLQCGQGYVFCRTLGANVPAPVSFNLFYRKGPVVLKFHVTPSTANDKNKQFVYVDVIISLSHEVVIQLLNKLLFFLNSHIKFILLCIVSTLLLHHFTF